MTATEQKLSIKSALGDDMLALAYLRARAEGLFAALFWEREPELRAFLEWCNRKDAVVVGCFSGVNLAGLGAVTSIKKRGNRMLGDVSEIFFREYQVQGVTEEFGRLLLKFAFEEVKMTDLYGVTPAKNYPAVRFLRHMGFMATEPIPNLCVWNGQNCDGIISWLTLEMWQTQVAPKAAHSEVA